MSTQSNIKRLVAVAIFSSIGLWSCLAAATDINGAGATFPYPVYAKWADAPQVEFVDDYSVHVHE